MDNLNDVVGGLVASFIEGAYNFVPSFVFALLIFVVGWFASLAIGKIFATLLYRLKFNSFFTGDKWEEAMKKAEIRTNPSEFLGDIVKWLVFIIIIWMAVGTLGLEQFADFMESIVNFLPSVAISILIFIAAVMIGDFLTKIVIAATEKSEFPYPKTAGLLVKTFIWGFAAFAILVELNFMSELLVVLFQGIVAFLVIAGGLSFGLGGQDAAKQLIKKVKKVIK